MLTRHPESTGATVYKVEARVSWLAGEELSLRYIVRGDTSRFQMPERHPARWADGLWRHTCFEAFVSVQGNPKYCEFNFSPSGEWAAYHFSRYRDGMPLEVGGWAPKIMARRDDGRFDLDATIHLQPLTMMPHNGCLRLGLCAVIEEKRGMLSYWALKHPRGGPDFHHPEGFALKIERFDTKRVSRANVENR